MELVQKKLSEWEKRVQEQAYQFSVEMEKAWIKRIQYAAKHLPAQSDGYRLDALNYFLDSLITTTAGIAGQYVNLSEAFEDNVVLGIRNKFTELRKQALMDKRV